jgi:DNA/RNA-binding domain of Phe-tRNA-synthetase-like protein
LDSLRTSVTAKTRNLVVVLFCPPERVGTHLSVALEQIAGLLTRYCGANVIAVRVKH